MATPHKGEHTKGGKRVLSLGGLFCGASGARPPSLSCFLWGFPFSRHSRCQVVTTLYFTGLAAVSGPSRKGPNPRTGFQVSPLYTAIVGGSFEGEEKEGAMVQQ